MEQPPTDPLFYGNDDGHDADDAGHGQGDGNGDGEDDDGDGNDGAGRSDLRKCSAIPGRDYSIAWVLNGPRPASASRHNRRWSARSSDLRDWRPILFHYLHLQH